MVEKVCGTRWKAVRRGLWMVALYYFKIIVQKYEVRKCSHCKMCFDHHRMYSDEQVRQARY